MFKRLRQLRISLAAKCQILFGTAVAAIIFAALFVPWQRIEQLTEQLNEKAAGAVADAVIGEHIMQQTALRDSSSAASYTTTAPSALFRARPPPVISGRSSLPRSLAWPRAFDGSRP
jgi:hypothetical protein